MILFNMSLVLFALQVDVFVHLRFDISNIHRCTAQLTITCSKSRIKAPERHQ